MKTSMKLILTIFLIIGISCSEELDGSELTAVYASANTKSSTDIFNTITGDVIGTSTLHRNSNGVTVNFKTTGLIPGHAYTLWWVVWNNPENCLMPGKCEEADFFVSLDHIEAVGVQLLYAAGHVAGNNGKGNFSGRLNENDDTGSIHELFGLPNFGGLQNAETAEIHAVLRSHGPKIPGQVSEQIGSYEGGCTVFLPAFTEIPDEEGECGDIIAALHRL